jgi:hypothetical protein
VRDGSRGACGQPLLDHTGKHRHRHRRETLSAPDSEASGNSRGAGGVLR